MSPRYDPIEDAEGFIAEFSVSRETAERLETYAGLLAVWQKAVNLVAPKTLDQVWHRHFADSAQLAPLIPRDAATILDLGSGAGFPGLVLSLMLADRASCLAAHNDGRADLAEGSRPPQMTLVESDQRKAAFLREVARQLSLPVNILSIRIEKVATQSKLVPVDVVTARALAPLSRLFELIVPLIGPGSVAVFPKGRDVDAEIRDAERNFKFDASLVPSCTDAEGRIVVVRHLEAKREG